MIPTLVVCAVVLLIWLEAKPLLQRRLAVTEKLASLEAQRVENERLAIVKPAAKDEDPMPQDMIDWAMAESFDWARDGKLARMRELYGNFHDWEKVRHAMMAEEDAAYRSTFT